MQKRYYVEIQETLNDDEPGMWMILESVTEEQLSQIRDIFQNFYIISKLL